MRAGAVAAGSPTARPPPYVEVSTDFGRASLADLVLLDITADQYSRFHAWSETMALPIVSQ